MNSVIIIQSDIDDSGAHTNTTFAFAYKICWREKSSGDDDELMINLHVKLINSQRSRARADTGELNAYIHIEN